MEKKAKGANKGVAIPTDGKAKRSNDNARFVPGGQPDYRSERSGSHGEKQAAHPPENNPNMAQGGEALPKKAAKPVLPPRNPPPKSGGPGAMHPSMKKTGKGGGGSSQGHNAGNRATQMRKSSRGS